VIDFYLNRRRFLQLGSLGLASATLSHALAAEALNARPARAKSCILFYMCGGASQLDTFDLKPQASDEIRGPFQPIASSVPGVPVCEHLPHLARWMHHFAQVRSLTHQETIHPQAVYQMLTGYPQTSSLARRGSERVDMPHLGSAFAQADTTRTALPKHIRLPEDTRIGGGSALLSLRGQDGGILRAEYDPFPIEISPDGVLSKPDIGRLAEVSRVRLADRMRLLDRLSEKQRLPLDPHDSVRLDTFHQQAFDILAAPSVQQAFDIEREAVATHERYGRHRQGQSLLLARRLVEAGARFVTVYWGPDEQDWADGKPPKVAGNPWDTHRNHFPLLSESLFPRLDQSLAALIADLAERGLLSETLVVWMGDFGRTPRISRPWASRDHWPGAFTALLAGAGVKGGDIYGRTDQFAAEVSEHPVSPADLTATLFDALGIDPSTQIRAANGALHRLSSGHPVRELFA
jgi:uncharacterized protein (DUF1501 family)